MKCDYSALAWVVAYGNLENVEIANLHPRLVNKTVEGHKIRVYHVHLRLQVEHFHFVLIGLDLFNIKLMSIHFCGETLDLLHLKFLNFVRAIWPNGFLKWSQLLVTPTGEHMGQKGKEAKRRHLTWPTHTSPHSSNLQLFAHCVPLTCGEQKRYLKIVSKESVTLELIYMHTVWKQ